MPQYYTSGEFAEKAHVSIRTIRYYDQKNLLKPAVRPFNSRLDKSKLVENGFKPLPTWPDAVKRYLEILKKQGFFEELK